MGAFILYTALMIVYAIIYLAIRWRRGDEYYMGAFEWTFAYFFIGGYILVLAVCGFAWTSNYIDGLLK
jgi:hypothetical protein